MAINKSPKLELMVSTGLSEQEVQELPVLFCAYFAFDTCVFVCRKSTNPHEPLAVSRCYLETPPNVNEVVVLFAFLSFLNLPRNTPVVWLMEFYYPSCKREDFLRVAAVVGFTNVVVQFTDHCMLHFIVHEDMLVLHGRKAKFPHYPEHCRVALVYDFAIDDVKYCMLERAGRRFSATKLDSDGREHETLEEVVEVCRRSMHPLPPYPAILFVTDRKMYEEQPYPDSHVYVCESGFEYACLVGFARSLTIREHRYVDRPFALQLGCMFDIQFGGENPVFLHLASRPLPLTETVKLVKTGNAVTVYYGDMVKPLWHEEGLLQLSGFGTVGDTIDVTVHVDENHVVAMSTTTPLVPSAMMAPLASPHLERHQLTPVMAFLLGYRKMSMKQLVHTTQVITARRAPECFLSAYLSFRTCPPTLGNSARRDLESMPSYVVYDFLKFIGQKFSEIQVNPHWPFHIVPAEDDEFEVSMMTATGRKQVRPEVLLGHLFLAMGAIAKKKTSMEIKIVKFIVPEEMERPRARQAIAQAARIAGIYPMF